MTIQRVLIWAGLLCIAWPTQYLIVSPARWTWRLCVKAARGLTLSAVGVILLLCLPVIGWIILILALVLLVLLFRILMLLLQLHKLNLEVV